MSKSAPASFFDSPDAEEFSRTLGVSRSFARYLCARGFLPGEASVRFLNPKLSQLTAPEGMADRGMAAERIVKALQSREPMCVFGDYDCDGITSAAIMTEVITTLGGSVNTLLASRFEGGYGVSAKAVERILATGAKLLITCDCGSSDHATLRVLSDAGLDIIVVDHHLVPEEPLPVVAFLNPHRPECRFPYKGLASCGLVLSLAAELRKRLGVALDLRQWLDLVAIGTIADVAPLDGDNRALVRAGLGVIAGGRRPAMRVLMELGKLEGEAQLTSHDVAFGIAPRLNAPGRMTEPKLALELLLAANYQQALGIGAQIEELSLRRREAQSEIVREAEAMIQQNGWQHEPALTLGKVGWNPGIVGIVAGRLADTYQRPTIVVGFDASGGRGSVRGPKGVPLFDCVSECSSVLERFGGHQAALGLEVSEGRLAELRQRFADACSKASPTIAVPGEPDAITLVAGDSPEALLSDLFLLEPCGEGNPAPEVALEAQVLRAKAVRGGHLKLETQLDGGHRLGVFAPNLGERELASGGRVALRGRLRPDRYRGGGAVELLATEMAPA